MPEEDARVLNRGWVSGDITEDWVERYCPENGRSCSGDSEVGEGWVGVSRQKIVSRARNIWVRVLELFYKLAERRTNIKVLFKKIGK